VLGQEAAKRPFRFGVGPGGVRFTGPREWAEFARRLEDVGFSTLSVGDHLTGGYGPVAAMTAAASATSVLRIGALTFCNDYRHPLVLAQEISTVDVVSCGRVELGLGAGWMRADYDRTGIQMDPPTERIDRLGEAVRILKLVFAADGPTSFTGAHYRVAAHDGLPRPVQRPWPPILIGGSGRRVLTLAGREADIVGLNVSLREGSLGAAGGLSATRQATLDKLATVRDAAGPRWPDLELEVYVHVIDVGPDRAESLERAAGALHISTSDAADSPHVLVGETDEICDVLLRRREELGISYISINGDAAERMRSVVARLAGQ
jgi:probable F420-dependent oxidoreductase